MRVRNFDVPSKENFQKLKSLNKLRTNNLNWKTACRDSAPPSLKTLIIEDCSNFHCDPELSMFPYIETLELSNLTETPRFQGLSHLIIINKLTLSAQTTIKITMSNLSEMITLKDLTLENIMIDNDWLFNHIEEDESEQTFLLMFLEKLKLFGHDAYNDPPFHWDLLKHFPKLKELSLKEIAIHHADDRDEFPNHIPQLITPPNLEQYKVSHCLNFKRVPWPKFRVEYDQE
jgi:hypothetical protein